MLKPAADIRHRYPRLDVLQGESGIAQIAALPTVDSVVHGITGAAGLIPAIAAVSAGKRLLLANKESLVIAGPLLRRLADHHDALIVPLDSEHNAVLQCLPDDDRLHGAVEQIWLTASGGGLRGQTDRAVAGRNAGGGLPSPQLEDGTQDHCGLGNHDEQGAGGHRGLSLV